MWGHVEEILLLNEFFFPIVDTCLIMVALCNRADHYIFMLWFVLLLLMAALCNRGAIIFLPCSVFLLSIFFYLLFFPRLISATVDRMSAILPHMVWP